MAAPAAYTYANSIELSEILQDKMPVLTLNDPVFTDIMPIRSADTNLVEWDQRDSYKGLMAPRAPGGGYGQVKREGVNRFQMKPGYYGDQKIIEEHYLTAAAQPGTFGNAVDITKVQGWDQDHLLTRMLQRLKLVAWTFCTTGAYTSLDQNGNLFVQDATSLTPFTTTVAWATVATATPLADLRRAKLLHRGHSVSFGRDSKLFLNSQDVNSLLANTNQNDLGSKRFIQVAAGSAISQSLTLADVNTYLMSADLPQIVEWDDNYLDDFGNVQMFIQPGFGVLVGKRTMGDPVAEFIMTRNPELIAGGRGKNGPNVAGLDNLYYDFIWKHNPMRGISTMGFNGAPAIYYPSAVVPFRC